LKKHNTDLPVSVRYFPNQMRAPGAVTQNKRISPWASLFLQRSPLPLLLLLGLYFCGPQSTMAQVAGTYRVDTKESHIEIHLFKGGFLSSLGDNHLISMTRFSGTAELSQMDGWTADLSGDAASLKVIDPWGNSSERKEVEDTMLGPTQLDVKNFPAIKLHSVSFDPTPQDSAWHLLAEVELHGVKRKVQFSLDCRENGERLQISGKKMFKLTDFDIQPFSTAFGAVKVKNDFEVSYNIVLERVH
jgi:polyisoprenoid-binding protein YceI